MWYKSYASHSISLRVIRTKRHKITAPTHAMLVKQNHHPLPSSGPSPLDIILSYNLLVPWQHQAWPRDLSCCTLGTLERAAWSGASPFSPIPFPSTASEAVSLLSAEPSAAGAAVGAWPMFVGA